ncbi:hypothetical protein O1D97_11155 [Marinomonas sp. 15G1-11]|uniref:Secreted protein n=1 Tax=Marinomonas phaeophyticola TaxID=3004091 RepID=A0ABT4JUY5_9GAMM|nr:hypothetical protein [Marinomonas sp. 15G1-11]MCZ2722182.1 hypothetical protein [Marinomonas sp. 15G1-11]
MRVEKTLSSIKIGIFAGFSLLLWGANALAGEADIIKVNVDCSASLCNMQATVLHEDSGWDHYADRWEVLNEDGEVIATRVLLHPHENEQPFTRGLQFKKPTGLQRVEVRAHDSVHQYGGKSVLVDLP